MKIFAEIKQFIKDQLILVKTKAGINYAKSKGHKFKIWSESKLFGSSDKKTINK